MRRRSLSVLALLGTGAAMVSGCGNAPPTSSAPPTTSARAASVSPRLDWTSVARRARRSFSLDDAGSIYGGQYAYGVTVSNEGAFRFSPVTRARAASAPLDRPLPRPVPGAALALVTKSIARGDELAAAGPSAIMDDGSVVTPRGAARETLQNGDDGVEQSWIFDAKPAGHGDLVVRIGASGEAFVSVTASGLHFRDETTGLGARYGHATWIDRAGNKTAIAATFASGEIVLRVPEGVVESSQFPAVLDPVIGAEMAVDQPVSGNAMNAQAGVALASDGASWIALWDDYRGAGLEVWGTRVTDLGVDPATVRGRRISPVGTTTHQYHSASVAFNGRDYVVAYGDAFTAGAPAAPVDDNFGQIVRPDLALVGTAFRIAKNVTGDGPIGYQAPPRVACDTGGATDRYCLAVWRDSRDDAASATRSLIWTARILDNNVQGSAETNQRLSAPPASTATEFEHRMPDVAFVGSKYHVVWSQRIAGVESGKFRLAQRAVAANNGVPMSSVGLIPIAGVVNEGILHSSLRFRDTSGTGAGPWLGALAVQLAEWNDAAPSVSDDLIALGLGRQNLVMMLNEGTNNTLTLFGLPGALSPGGQNSVGIPSVAFFPTGELVVATSSPEGAPNYSGTGTLPAEPTLRYIAARFVADTTSGGFQIQGPSVLVGATGLRSTNDYVPLQAMALAASSSSPSAMLAGFPEIRENVAGATGNHRYNVGGQLLAAGTTAGLAEVGNVFPINARANDRTTASVAFDGTHYLATWEDYATGPVRYAPDVVVRAFDINGNAVGSELRVAPVVSVVEGDPRVAFNGTSFLVTWTSNDGVSSKVRGAHATVASGGITLGAAFDIAAPATGSARSATTAGGGGNTLVVWEESSASGSTLKARVIQPNGTFLGASPTTVAAPATGLAYVPTSVAFGNGEFVTTFQRRNVAGDSDVLGARLSNQGALLSAAGGVAIATGALDQRRGIVAFGNGTFVVTWFEGTYDALNPANASYDVYASRLDLGATPAATGKLALSAKAELQANSVVAFDGASFFFSWTDRDATNAYLRGAFLAGSSTAPLAAPVTELAIESTSDKTHFYVPAAVSNGAGRVLVLYSRTDGQTPASQRAFARFIDRDDPVVPDAGVDAATADAGADGATTDTSAGGFDAALDGSDASDDTTAADSGMTDGATSDAIATDTSADAALPDTATAEDTAPGEDAATADTATTPGSDAAAADTGDGSQEVAVGEDSGGCGCETPGTTPSSSGGLALSALGVAAIVAGRRRRR